MVVKTRLEIGREIAKKKMDDFLALQKSDPLRAREYAIKELIKTGVLNPDGTSKKQICSWPD